MSKKHPLVKKVLIDSDQIKKRTKELASQISEYYRSQNINDNTVLLVGLLKGCIPFMAEFMNNFDYECDTDYMVMSSYQGGTKADGNPKIVLDLNSNLKGRHILILEDVIDSGLTLDFVKRYFYNRQAADVKIVTLIDKPMKRKVDLQPDWSGFEIGDEFLIGFGLDYQERLRNLPYVASCDVSKLKDWKW
ncbi:hypoxanthine phosphoribosyltransferase [Entomoplasma freundtii]|uniref:Hypoxanthine phosphoribosyltransferase n=1 Tax=Entomoplasma freundtii TaxID=74700 RepID=A0A2K8NQS9_9MOLU|nr:hypoxanthine phosphoribosyltransferase [Entomoplasma freundtii]ATZ16205.1 hypoxanthine-guanine phosphoribosyltransferase [Entomoplasma freundtii]TDY56894.1 hypoxanthine phosphoribosyltransferase [Entomoplasma freundtii]